MKNKEGIFFARWEHNWDADFAPYVGRVKGLGFDLLEINAGTFVRMAPASRTPSPPRIPRTGSSCRCASVFRGRWTWPQRTPARGTRESLFSLRSRRSRSAAMCAPSRASSTTPGRSSCPRGVEKQRYVDRSVAGMREAVKAAEAAAYVERVGSPALKVHLDTFHMNIEEDDPAHAIKTAGKRLGHFHLGENNRRPSGVGFLPRDAIFDAPTAIGYPGYLVMEPSIMMGGSVGRDIEVNRDQSAGIDLDKSAPDTLQCVQGSPRSPVRGERR